MQQRQVNHPPRPLKEVCYRLLRWHAIAIAAAAMFLPGLHAQKGSSGSPSVLAVFNGTPILEDQLPPDLLSQLRRMEQQIYLVRLRGLHEVLDRQLIAAEATKEKIDPNELIRSQLKQIPDPTEEQLKAYFEEHKSAINEPYDEAREGIRNTLKNANTQSAGRAFTQGLLQEAVNDGNLLMFLRPPTVEINADPARQHGAEAAPVSIVVFSDFSCPYCKKADAALADMIAQHPGQVRVSYRDFPLPSVHPNALLAAEGARCAEQQGQYWPYHSLLFNHLGHQTHEDLMSYAHDLKLDEASFQGCLDGKKTSAMVQQDRDLGVRAGVVATPAFFVNGTFLEGAQAITQLEAIVQNSTHAKAQPPSQTSNLQ